jgi:CheY-like chemotaxis protein
VPHTLVFADDDDLVRLVLTEALRDAGVEVHAVPDGIAAVQLCRELAPETVLLDLDMPRMDGFEAARQIRAAECTRRLVALTGRPTQDACRKAEAAGFDEVLSKPISVALLMRALFPEAEEDEALLD